MATTRVLFYLVLLISSSLLLVHPQLGGASFIDPNFIVNNQLLKRCQVDRIYQFGDSLSDTGNLILESAIGAATRYAKSPYGETYFNKPTGRCSNGLLMIDYIALNAGLPFLNPYHNSSANFSNGANFAVAGATALATDYLASKNIFVKDTNSSLGVQLDWMSTLFSSLCSTPQDCAQKLKHSLFIVGEIGGNDYNYGFFEGRTMDEVTSLVPGVIQVIMGAVRKVISYGASRVIVPGNFPIGCFPIYLTMFKTNNSAAYDEHHCLKDLNNFSMHHNEQLELAIEELRQENPNTIILYGDYYQAFQWVFYFAPFLGFDPNLVEKACCGTGGDYNFNFSNQCADPGVPVCPDPTKYISWDGIHPTEEAYEMLATWLVLDIFPKLHCLWH